MRAESGAEREAIKELAKRWEGRLDEAVERDLQNPETTREQFIQSLWEKGILDRLAPQDPSEFEARKTLGHQVWEGGRDDSELYWRILYGSAVAKHNTEQGYSSAASSQNPIVGILPPVYRAITARKEWFPEMQEEQPRNPFFDVLSDFMEHAKSELQDLGETPHDRPIPFGAMGTWRNVPVTIEYAHDGSIAPRAENDEGNQKLYQWLKNGTVSASELNPEGSH